MEKRHHQEEDVPGSLERQRGNVAVQPVHRGVGIDQLLHLNPVLEVIQEELPRRYQQHGEDYEEVKLQPDALVSVVYDQVLPPRPPRWKALYNCSHIDHFAILVAFGRDVLATEVPQEFAAVVQHLDYLFISLYLHLDDLRPRIASKRSLGREVPCALELKPNLHATDVSACGLLDLEKDKQVDHDIHQHNAHGVQHPEGVVLRHCWYDSVKWHKLAENARDQCAHKSIEQGRPEGGHSFV
mmetsp:Transcript_121818/g.355987  ORF Transcript_121818/g.355987 Transcript_121818/m.355987 type:complete len:241 (+) Transcript_121818:470-1192(+)